jgi:hypothetical protein
MDLRDRSRRAAATALTAMVIGMTLGTAGCGDGDAGNARTPSKAADREAPTTTGRSPQPARSTRAEPVATRPSASAAPRAASSGPTSKPASRTPPPAAAAAVPTGAAATPASAPGPAISAVPAAAAASGIGPGGWLLLLTLGAALVVGVLLLYRSQRRSAWDSEARALGSETRAEVGPPLSSVLIAGRAGPRGLTWPPLRASLTDLVSRWNDLVERAHSDERRTWSAQISALLQNLVAAVDAENEAMVLGEDWTVVRPHVRQTLQSLTAALAGRILFEPPAAGPAGSPAYPG